VDVIKNVDPEVLRRFHKKWYTPKNMALVCVGDFTKAGLRQVLDMMEATFAADIAPAGWCNNYNGGTKCISIANR
jgi:predicted Zn-dependent peptidase